MAREKIRKCENCEHFHIDCYSGRECLHKNNRVYEDGRKVFFSPPEKFYCDKFKRREK
jgi:hypothetical protein